MARKNLLAGLSGTKLTAVNSDAPVSAPTARSSPLPYAGMGALGAVTRSIDDLAARANAAKELEARLTSGQVIVELDPALIDVSFMIDRMSHDDEEYQALRNSIAQQGQDSPILVRPHPSDEGRYQVAFGHRRLRAAKELSRRVRAVVRQLSDRELILAQGQENSARANLSFIERARFAHSLEEAGYDRETIMQALSVDKTTLSRLISVVARIPTETIEAIGPAPGTGRDRWVALANLCHAGKQAADLPALVSSEAFRGLDSDARFAQVFSAFEAPREVKNDPGQPVQPGEEPVGPGRSPAQVWHHSTGTPVMRVKATDRSVVLSIDNRAIPGFGEYLLSEMESLVSTYLKQRAATEQASAAKRSKQKPVADPGRDG
ncbi:MAG: plasmid partitioning protein RepB [Alphaproteobacteria bacterium]|nr:plasmid partitioning protein RepB [Alphaproteobacteria bacterium]